MNSDSSCKQFLCLVLIFAMAEKQVSHKFDDTCGNKAVTALLPKEGQSCLTSCWNSKRNISLKIVSIQLFVVIWITLPWKSFVGFALEVWSVLIVGNIQLHPTSRSSLKNGKYEKKKLLLQMLKMLHNVGLSSSRGFFSRFRKGNT